MLNISTLCSVDDIIFIDNEIKASYQSFPLRLLNINSQYLCLSIFNINS